jgi:hypothetical protein
MTKFNGLRASFDCPLRDSLSVIREIHGQLHALTGVMTTADALASRIELCDVLLVEISSIRSSLAKDLQRTRESPHVLS